MSRPAKRAYQPDEASAKIAAAGLVGVLTLVLVAAAVAWALQVGFAGLTRHPPTTPLERAAVVAPGPRLQAAPGRERLTLDAAGRARIEAYGWADRQKGLARIPIERAMALQAARGWPDRETSP